MPWQRIGTHTRDSSPSSRWAAVRTGPVTVAMPCAKWSSRIAFGVSRVRIAVRRTSSSAPSTGL